jgi:hypothetical protein
MYSNRLLSEIIIKKFFLKDLGATTQAQSAERSSFLKKMFTASYGFS